MRKVMLLAAMLAMVLAAAAPAFGQATAIDEGNTNAQYGVNQEIEQNADVEDSICTNVSQVAANQYNTGDANAAAVDGDAVASIAQELDITQAQVNECFNTTVVDGDNGFVKTVTATAPADKTVTATAPADEVVVVEGEEKVVVATATATAAAVEEGAVVVEGDEGETVIVEEGTDTATVVAEDDTATVVAEDGDTATVVAEDGDTATVVAEESATAAAAGELPSTGGASVLALGAGVLLVAGGLVARRIVR